MLTQKESPWEIKGLPAEGPDPDLKDELMLFGQFVGDWNILECRNLQQGGTWTSQPGEIYWRWILEGRAVQDTWGGIDEGKFLPHGTTVRFYDPRIDAWRSTYLSQLGGCYSFHRGQVGCEIVVEAKNPEGIPTRWIFSEITNNSFRWRGEESRDGEKTWILIEEMRVKRK